MHFKILNVQEDDHGHLYVDYQCGCGPNGDVQNRTTGPFTGSDENSPWDDLRLWIAMNAEAQEQRKVCRNVPADIAALVGKPADTANLAQQFAPQLNQYRARAEQAAREMQALQTRRIDAADE